VFRLADALLDLAPGLALPGAEDLWILTATVDSRQVAPGAIFCALRGERTDGHRYVESALQAGAVAALVDHVDALSEELRASAIDLVAGRYPAHVQAPAIVVVPDVLQALQRMARGRRVALPEMVVVGVTGSVGKTTTKESIAAVLSARFQVARSRGNQNNEIGLPLTLLSLQGSPHYAVLEMGMYDIGEIAELCEIAGPRMGVVTNVGPVHLERLGSIDRIAQAKAELVKALPADGLALLCGDDTRVAAMAALTPARTLTYGLASHNGIWADKVRLQGLEGTRFTVHVAEDSALGISAYEHKLTLSTLGEQGVLAALPGIALGRLTGMTWDEIQSGLNTLGYGLRLVPMAGVKGITLLDDTYNASPVAMCAALRALGSVPRRGLQAGRRIAVLGDMLELGVMEEEGHREVGRCAAGVVDLLITVGPRARMLAEEACVSGMEHSCVHTLWDTESAIALLREMIGTGDVVLVKGSHSMGMSAIVEALRLPPSDRKEPA
jgi:UDP-N-acetylmuramoyl-tripeptide--D-alanyl-D-alanine ligase